MVAPIIAAAIVGGAGGGIANIALAPVSSGASLLNSYWYGAGLILGERDMYTFHWEKIKKRLENGEDYLSVLESEMNPAITAISAYSLKIMKETGELYKKAGVEFILDLIADLLNPFFSGDRNSDDDTNTNPDGLLSFDSATIAAWTDATLQKNYVSSLSDPQLYTTFTVLLIKQEKQKRDQEVFTEPDAKPPPDPNVDPDQIFDIPDPSTIPLIDRKPMMIHALGRIVRSLGSHTFFGETNPQRNGNWQRKKTFPHSADGIKWGRTNWPATTSSLYNEYSFKSVGDYDERYWIRKADITVKNFPNK